MRVKVIVILPSHANEAETPIPTRPSPSRGIIEKKCVCKEVFVSRKDSPCHPPPVNFR
jgi:hypothetical protein